MTDKADVNERLTKTSCCWLIMGILFVYVYDCLHFWSSMLPYVVSRGGTVLKIGIFAQNSANQEQSTKKVIF